ncbi:MAG: MFS transporter [Oscillospiraceae bacterium]|jgi:OPA family glycerol-3-phosphate transporter-like MFS transporter/OPA family sugar phosphate sensor protein UhpC-like MFS transporter|nr:MFS transporter [Oscillospiraceae bacterium]
MKDNISTAIGESSRNGIFSEPPAKPIITDTDEIKKQYTFWRNSIFIISYLIYVIAYMGRRNFSIAMPFMNSEMGINAEEQGLVLMISSFVYGLGRFINGSIADRGNVRTSLPKNIILAGLFNAGMILLPLLAQTNRVSHNVLVIYMCLFWGISNWYQSALFPYCAKSLIRWFPNTTRATWWASWSTSHELGSFLAMNISLPIAKATFLYFGKWALEAMFFVPFLLSSLIGIIGFFALQDKPTSIGLPDVEEICGTKAAKLTIAEKEQQDQEAGMSYYQILKKHIIYNKNMWNMGLICFCIYIFRMGPVDWLFKILIGEQVHSTNFLETIENIDSLAALKSSMLCGFGFLGTLFAPLISEKLFAGRRVPACFWCLAAGAVSVFGIWVGSSPFSPAIGHQLAKNIVIFLSLGVAGFGVCAPQVLIGGVVSVESASKRVGAAAAGFVGFLGYFGAAVSQIINGKLLVFSISRYGDARIILLYWGCIALLGAVLCIPIWNMQPRKEYSH